MKKLYILMLLTGLSTQVLAKKDSVKKTVKTEDQIEEKIEPVDMNTDSASLSWQHPERCSKELGSNVVDDSKCKNIKSLGDKPADGFACCADVISEGENPYVD